MSMYVKNSNEGCEKSGQSVWDNSETLDVGFHEVHSTYGLFMGTLLITDPNKEYRKNNSASC